MTLRFVPSSTGLCGPTHVARLEFPRETGLILRCAGKAASRESSLLFRLERGPGIALQAMQEKKDFSSRGRGRLRRFLELRRP